MRCGCNVINYEVMNIINLAAGSLVNATSKGVLTLHQLSCLVCLGCSMYYGIYAETTGTGLNKGAGFSTIHNIYYRHVLLS